MGGNNLWAGSCPKLSTEVMAGDLVTLKQNEEN